MKTKISSHTTHENFSTFLHRIVTFRYLNSVREKHALERNHRMAVYAHEWVGISIYTAGVYERHYLDTILGLLAPLKENYKHWTVLDIGANIGNHTLYFADHFARIHAFEPSKQTFHLLSFNAQYTHNIELHNFGLGEREEELSLYEDNVNYGASSAVYRKDTPQNIEKIDIKRLDDLENDFADLGIIKVDVEGMELSVFKGGLKTIRKYMPVIFFEQHLSDFSDHEPGTQSTRLLSTLGYEFYWIEHKQTRAPWIVKRLRNIGELFKGRTTTFEIVTAPEIPKSSYAMLIALPPRLQEAL